MHETYASSTKSTASTLCTRLLSLSAVFVSMRGGAGRFLKVSSRGWFLPSFCSLCSRLVFSAHVSVTPSFCLPWVTGVRFLYSPRQWTRARRKLMLMRACLSHSVSVREESRGCVALLRPDIKKRAHTHTSRTDAHPTPFHPMCPWAVFNPHSSPH